MLRLYVASMDYADDISVSERGIKEMSEAYRKIRNTFRYLLGNLEDYQRFDPDGVDPAALHEIDRWALGQLNKVIRDVRAAYERFEFYRVYQRIYQFCAVELSSFYLDVLKDRLYAEAARGPGPPGRPVRAGPAARSPDPAAGPDHPAHGRGVVGLPARRAPTSRASVHLAEFPEPDPRWDDASARCPLGRAARAPRAGARRARRPAEEQADRQCPGGQGHDRHHSARAAGCPIASCWRRSASSRKSRSSPTPRPRSRPIIGRAIAATPSASAAGTIGRPSAKRRASDALRAVCAGGRAPCSDRWRLQIRTS